MVLEKTKQCCVDDSLNGKVDQERRLTKGRLVCRKSISAAVQTFMVTALVFSAASCVHSPKEMSLPNEMPIRYAIVIDSLQSGEVYHGPSELADSVGELLQSRGFLATQNTDSTLLEKYTAQRETLQRLGVLHQEQEQHDKPVSLLIELRPQMYSVLNGLYRWSVVGKVSIQRANGPNWSRQFDASVFLKFDHEREMDAVRAAKPRIMRYVNDVVNTAISGLGSGYGGVPEQTSDDADAVSPPVIKSEPAASSASERSELIYFVLVDRFPNGDNANDRNADASDPAAFHGGDFKGVISKLDELAEMGVTTLWLSPIYEMRREKFHGHGAFHGYWVKDFNAMESGFGSEEDLAMLRAEAEKRGMRLMLDIVTNHMAFDAPLVTEKPAYFHGRGDIVDWSNQDQLVHHDVHGLPDLAQENPEVYAMLLGSTKMWIDQANPTMIRLDAAGHVPASFLRQFQDDLSEQGGSDVRVAGEIFQGDPNALAQLVKESDLSHYYDFPMYYALKDVFCERAPLGRVAKVLAADRLFGDAHTPLVFLDNHDLPRLASSCDGNRETVSLAVDALLSLRGIPVMNYGTEWLMEGATEPQNRGDLPTAGVPPLHDVIAQGMQMRSRRPSLSQGKTRIIELRDEVLVFSRQLEEERTLIAIHLGEKELAIDLSKTLGEGTALSPLRNHPDAGVESSAVRNKTQLSLLPQSVSLWDIGGEPRSLDDGDANQTQVDLLIRHNGLASDESLLVVGDGGNLTAWNVDKAIRAKQVKPNLWQASLRGQEGDVISFKLVVQTEGESPVWESGANRYVLMRNGEQSGLEIELLSRFERDENKPAG